MKNITFCLLLTGISLISCSKSDDNGGTPAAIKYMSLTPGSSWNYELINNATPSTTQYTLTSTIKDTVVSGRTYHVFTNSTNNSSEYYGIAGSDYYTYQKLPDALGGTLAENLYLKDNAAINTTWIQTYNVTVSGLPLTVTVTNKIQNKGFTKVVNGVTYTDVIDVYTTLSVSLVPASALTTNIHYYYAPKFGMIQNDIQIDLNFMGIVNNTNTTTKLKTATIL